MSDEEEEEIEDEEEEEEQDEKQEDKEKLPENDEFNEFRKFNPHSVYANMHKTQNKHNPLEYYYQRQLPIPFQPSSYWADRVQFHQQEIDRAKLILDKMQQHNDFPYHNNFDYERPPNNNNFPYDYKPNFDPSTRYQTLQYSNQQSFPRNQQQNQNYDFSQPGYLRQQRNPNYPPMTNQNYFNVSNSQYRTPQQFNAIPPQQHQYYPNIPIPQPSPPLLDQPPQPYYYYQQNQLQQYQQDNQRSQRGAEHENALPNGVTQFSPEIPQPITQDHSQPIQQLDEQEQEYLEFLRYKENIKKQQQFIDDKDFQDFLEFRKMKQQQIFRSQIQQEEEKRLLTDLYRRKNRQIYSEEEFQPIIARKREFQQLSTVPPHQEPNLEIDKAINVLIKSKKTNDTIGRTYNQ